MSDLERVVREVVENVIDERMGSSPMVREMVDQYGETVTNAEAAKMLGVHVNTVANMKKDGRLSGSSFIVSVRSIAKYLEAGRPSAQSVRKASGYYQAHPAAPKKRVRGRPKKVKA